MRIWSRYLRVIIPGTMCLLLAMLFAYPGPVSAQGRLGRLGVWGNLTVGTVTLGSLGGVASINVRYRSYSASLRFAGGDEHSGLFSSGDSVNDAGILLGRVFGFRRAQIQVGAGLSRVTAKKFLGNRDCSLFCTTYYDDLGPVVGIPYQISLALKLIPWKGGVGLGATAFGNLNSVMSYSGIGLSLYLGVF